jgi:tRNA U34 5-carboxymethylaminomethyl modifying enzyme MnmG/GidA
MEIHSSSRAFIPAKYKTLNNKDESIDLAKKNAPQTQETVKSLNVIEIDNRKVNDITTLLPSQNFEPQTNIPNNVRIAHALNAYITENNTLITNQQPHSISSSIDFFV